MTRTAATAKRPTTNALAAWWLGLSEPHRRSLLATVGGLTALLMLLGLLPAAGGTWLAAFSVPAWLLFGWSTALALGGALVWAATTLIGALRGRDAVPGRFVVGAAVALALVLAESRLLAGSGAGGLLGRIVAWPLERVSGIAHHLIVLGALALDGVVALRIGWRDLGRAARRLQWPEPAQPIIPAMPTPMVPPPASGPFSPPSLELPPLPRVAPSPAGSFTPPAPSPPPPAHDIAADSTYEALRVPAYLRRGLRLDVPGAAPEPSALPPLAGAPGQSRSRPPSADPSSAASLRPPHALPAEPSRWALPPLSLLSAPVPDRAAGSRDHAERLARIIERTLHSFGVEAEVRRSDITVGPAVIRFGLRPLDRPRVDDRGRAVTNADGDALIARTRVSRIMNLRHDLALALAVKSLRMEAPVPGRPFIGVEVPNPQRRTVALREVLESREFRDCARQAPLTVALGCDVAGRARAGDLAGFPHVLVAGATGAGKSAFLNALIAGLLTCATPDVLRLLLIDPKRVELALYADIPHLLAPVVTDPAEAVAALERALAEMDRRLRLFARHGVRHLEGYAALRAGGQTPELEPLPRIVIVIDELADLMQAAGDAVERAICRLAQLARATGIHLVVATQRPSVDVVTGLIKANIPTRVAFMVPSAVDSRTILDHGGAEHLLGRGDLLFLAADAPAPERLQGAWIADGEITDLARFWQRQASQIGAPTRWELPAAPDPAADWDDPVDQPARARAVRRRRIAPHR